MEENKKLNAFISWSGGKDAALSYLPLWGEENRVNLIEEFIEAGFEAVIVATKKDLLGQEWLGRRIDYDFVGDISKIKGVDISGEGGEYRIGPHIQEKNQYFEI